VTAAGAAWLDGELVDPGATLVALDDHGLTVGDGVFETLLVRGGRAPAWERHAARLETALAATGIGPLEHDLADAVATVVAASGLDDARVRITITSGPGPGGLRRGPRPTVLVLATPLGPPPPPAAVVTAPWARNERGPLVGVKTTSYGEAAALLARAAAVGADDVLLGDTRGRLSEAITANVVVELDGSALTPSLACGCLPGTVRAVLLEAGTVEEAEIPLGRVREASEVVLTSAVAGVRPVAHVDGTALPRVDGPLAAHVRATLDEGD
jgi:branched-chain amino acid aminotransferase